MRIAIVTITDGQNYGNRLQNYALQKVLQEDGHDVVTIARRTSKDFTPLKYLSFLLKMVIKKIIRRPSGKHWLMRKRKFSQFNKRYLRFSKEVLYRNKAPKKFAEQYDCFIVGSDQVWNAGFKIISEDIDNYLLKFAPPKKRVAYSASFGTDRITAGYEKTFEEELKQFKAISVREKSGKTIVESFGVKAVVTLDPTMLLSREVWHIFSKKPAYVRNNHFILTYFLSGRDKETEKYIKYIANGRTIFNLDVEDAIGSKIDSAEIFSTSPDEFVWLIENADCILTDSFHATVFSIIFNKPFCVFDRKEKGESYRMSSRIDTLLGLFGLERFKYDGEMTRVDLQSYDSDTVDRILTGEREKSFDFLRGALANEN